MPIWIWIVVAGIIGSAIMSIKSLREDQKIDSQWIEEEGAIYMERMEKEKKERASLIG